MSIRMTTIVPLRCGRMPGEDENVGQGELSQKDKEA